MKDILQLCCVYLLPLIYMLMSVAGTNCRQEVRCIPVIVHMVLAKYFHFMAQRKTSHLVWCGDPLPLPFWSPSCYIVQLYFGPSTLFIGHLESTSVKIVCNRTYWSIISSLAALSSSPPPPACPFSFSGCGGWNHRSDWLLGVIF